MCSDDWQFCIPCIQRFPLVCADMHSNGMFEPERPGFLQFSKQSFTGIFAVYQFRQVIFRVPWTLTLITFMQTISQWAHGRIMVACNRPHEQALQSHFRILKCTQRRNHLHVKVAPNLKRIFKSNKIRKIHQKPKLQLCTYAGSDAHEFAQIQRG